MMKSFQKLAIAYGYAFFVHGTRRGTSNADMGLVARQIEDLSKRISHLEGESSLVEEIKKTGETATTEDSMSNPYEYKGTVTGTSAGQPATPVCSSYVWMSNVKEIQMTEEMCKELCHETCDPGHSYYKFLALGTLYKSFQMDVARPNGRCACTGDSNCSGFTRSTGKVGRMGDTCNSDTVDREGITTGGGAPCRSHYQSCLYCDKNGVPSNAGKCKPVRGFSR